MEDLSKIIKELEELDIQHETYRKKQVVWCPAGLGSLRREDYSQLLFLELDKNEIFLGHYSIKDNWDKPINIKTVNIHEAISIIANFYFNEEYKKIKGD